jgi:hypothetical protein
MKFKTGAAFRIGASHRVCEDYALVNNPKLDYYPYVVLCDGCSSADNTDFGARLLAKAAESALYRTGYDERAFLNATLASGQIFCRSIGLDQSALRATLMVIYASPDDKLLHVILVGDGVIAVRNRNRGEIFVTEYRFTSGAPYYLQYEASDEDRSTYVEQFGTEFILQSHSRDVSVSPSPATWDMSKYWVHLCYDTEDIDMVAVMSDGVTSFVNPVETETDKRTESVPTIEIVEEFLAFKRMTGPFVEKRFNRAFRTFAENGWKNLDDVSIGVVHAIPEMVG